MVAGKNPFVTIIYTSCLISASLKEICLIVNEELMPQDLGDVHSDGRTDRRSSATLYAPTSCGIKKKQQSDGKTNPLTAGLMEICLHQWAKFYDEVPYLLQ
jgi:hypothetical protein